VDEEGALPSQNVAFFYSVALLLTNKNLASCETIFLCPIYPHIILFLHNLICAYSIGFSILLAGNLPKISINDPLLLQVRAGAKILP
jgi:hypothetical protein